MDKINPVNREQEIQPENNLDKEQGDVRCYRCGARTDVKIRRTSDGGENRVRVCEMGHKELVK